MIAGTNITLGYDIRDSVNNVDVALDAALNFTTLRKRPTASNSLRECECSENTTQPYVVALIGGARSEISQHVNAIVGVSSLPQISYSSTSISLSDKTNYRCVLSLYSIYDSTIHTSFQLTIIILLGVTIARNVLPFSHMN
jgi:hypothetical protein